MSVARARFGSFCGLVLGLVGPIGLSPKSAAAASLPRVAYQVSATSGSWRPLALSDIAKTIEEAALEVLSKPGLMQLVRIDPKKPGEVSGDYRIEIRGRILDEAETHTVFLSFGSGEKSDLPSFSASDTVSLTTRVKEEMLARIDQSARRAASQLLVSLKPALEQALRPSSVASAADLLHKAKALPFDWSEVKIPTQKLSSGKADLDSKSGDERNASLRLLTSLVLGQDSSARHLLENCVLRHSQHEMRLACLKALAPAARRHAPTQRVVIEAFRKDKESAVRVEASEQMTYFTGDALGLAVQAWLEATAQGFPVGPIDQLGDLPNLDLAIYQCLVSCGKKPKYQRGKSSCIALLPPVSGPRRKVILWKFLEETNAESPYYLEGAGEREGSTGTDWQRALEALLEHSTQWDPALEDILWARYQRELSEAAIDVLSGYGAPSERLADRLIQALQSGGDHQTLFGLKRMAKLEPKLRPKIREKLAEMLHTKTYHKKLRESSLTELLKELEKESK